jgi:SAM-dependent methyltransferase
MDMSDPRVKMVAWRFVAEPRRRIGDSPRGPREHRAWTRFAPVDGPAWRLFDRVAGEYDEVVPFFAEYGRSMMAAIDPPSGCRFLDLGAGRGALTAAALDRGCLVTAVDAAPAMAARLVRDHPAARTCVMDAQALAFATGSFDVVGASFVIHVLDRPAAGVAEAYRVLAPGGRFAFTGSSARSNARPGTPDPGSLGTRFNALFEEFGEYLPAGASMGQSIDTVDLLTGAGFVDLRDARAEVAVRFADNETLWRWAMSHGYRAFVEDLPAQRQVEFRERVLTLSMRDGILRRSTGVWSGRKP